MHVVITCEHGSFAIPSAFRALFDDVGGNAHEVERIVQSHEGWDLGAQNLARRIFAALKSRTVESSIESCDIDKGTKESKENWIGLESVTLHESHATRLLVELNRSPRHARLFSRYTIDADDDVKKCILDEHWHPYRDRVIADIQAGLELGDVLHLSIHSFTPVFDDVERNAAIGLLYDPSRRDKEIAHQWRKHLRGQLPGYRVRCNYPYTGVQDGFQPWLRKEFSAASKSGAYAAIELEVNNAFLVEENAHLQASKPASPMKGMSCLGFQQKVARSVRSLVELHLVPS
ncbi:MAG: hypothetical protein GY822_28920 [Deltaproteobacteria bacterium]|nr:hypothetical protein [Deltaproteobacteria bacterium]